MYTMLHNDKHLSDVNFTIQMMQMNYIVFRMNYGELRRLHQQFDQPLNFREVAMQTERGQQLVLDTTIEFTRLLHNFLASAKMLVDVTRRWVRQQFTNSTFLSEYNTEIKNRFANNVQAQFLEDLRNFTLHRTLPISVPELRMHEIDEHTLKSSLSIVLRKDFLLEWDGWSELGNIQIQMAFEGDVDILSICNQYFDNVTEFTQWLFWRARELFSTEVEQINTVIQKMRGEIK